MFKPDQTKSWIEAKPEQVAYISTSVNRPIVVVPGRAPETAQAYVCVLRTAQGYEFYIYLHLISSNLGLLYKWDQGAMPKERVGEVQQSATEFTESMGFMMTDLRWREMTPAQKNETFNNLPIFFRDISRFKEQTEEEVLEIEPAKEELIVEPIEEPVETVTAGDFVIQEEAFAEDKAKEELVFEEVPEIPEQHLTQQSGSQAGSKMSEEDILLENLEIKEEPKPASVSVPEIKTASSELLIEIEETPPVPEQEVKTVEQKEEKIESQEEIIWEKELKEEKTESAFQPQIEVSVESEVPSVAVSEPVVEEISLEDSGVKLAEPAPELKTASEELGISSPKISSESIPARVESEPLKTEPPVVIQSHQEEVRIEAGKPEGEVEIKKPEAGELSEEDLRLILRFLVMF